MRLPCVAGKHELVCQLVVNHVTAPPSVEATHHANLMYVSLSTPAAAVLFYACDAMGSCIDGDVAQLTGGASVLLRLVVTPHVYITSETATTSTAFKIDQNSTVPSGAHVGALHL